MNSIKVWQGISEYMDRWGIKPMLSPICNNQELLPGLRLSLFVSWHDKGIRVIGGMFEDNILMTFQQLQVKFNFSKEQFFGYLQLRNFINSLVKPAEDTPIYSEAEKFILELKDLIPFLFDPFLLCTLLIRSIGHKEILTKMGEHNEYIEEDWQEAVHLVHTAFTCSRLAEIQYKILHRLHITPATFHKISKTISPICSKCKTDLGSHFH